MHMIHIQFEKTEAKLYYRTKESAQQDFDGLCAWNMDEPMTATDGYGRQVQLRGVIDSITLADVEAELTEIQVEMALTQHKGQTSLNTKIAALGPGLAVRTPAQRMGIMNG